ncbi:MAG: glycosyl transferase, partial [Nitrosopumilus sp. D6]
GMSVNNTVAVFDAVLGKKSEFLRTPKYGIITKNDDWRDKAYNLPFTQTTLLEIFFGVYGVMAVFAAIFSSNPVFVPIIALQTVGFFYIASMSLSHTRFKRDKSSPVHADKREKMARITYKLALAGITGIILFGGYMAISGYNSDIYPLDRIRGHMDGIIGSSDPEMIHSHLVAVQTDMDLILAKLPEGVSDTGEPSKNPVWLFPTDSTNFVRMKNDIDHMIAAIEKIATIPRDNSAYNTGMLVAGERALGLRLNIVDATPYMYVSIANIIFSTMWIAAILGIFAALKHKKDQLGEADKSGI